MLELLAQPFMEGQRRGFGATVIDILGLGQERRHASYGHDMSVAGVNHGGKELPHQVKVRKNIDLEYLACGLV